MSFRPLSRGNTATVVTERGSEIKIQYAIVSLSQLIASHDSGLKINKKYPAKLQPRDRARIASATQIDQIARNIRPELLGACPKASDGAPIIGSDYVVESGNARTIGLTRAYRNKDQRARYVAWIAEIAPGLGLDANAVRWADQSKKQPVLVRLRLTKVDRVQFAIECNEQSVAAMSSVEQALIDAEKLDSAMLSLFQPDEVGNIASASNRDFIRAFVDRAVAPTEHGRFMDSDGYISQDGVRRIQHALIAKAYGETSALERLAEATEDNVRRISNVLIRKAAQFACLKIAIAEGARHPFDLTLSLSHAMRKLSTLRDRGQSVSDFLAQRVLLADDDLSTLERRILAVFEEHKLSGRVLEDILQCFLESVELLGHPAQTSIFAEPLPSLEKLFDLSVEKALAPERKAQRLAVRKKSRGAWDRSAAALKAWVTIRARRLQKAKAA